VWRQIQANVYGHAVETVAADEGAAFGAAVLAGVGARIWSSVDEACDALVQTGTRTPAEPDIVKAMNAQYELYRRVYPALRGIRSTKEPNVGLHTAS
jgi:xylulokinase